MTDQELHEFAADNLYYDLWMLYETGTRLVHDPDVHDDWVVKNAVIESFAIHARSLTIFLYPESSPKRADDVNSFEYVRDVQQWTQARGDIPPELTLVKRRTAKEIAHLTTGRHPPGSPQKVWSPESIARAFFEPLRLFHAHVPSSRLDAGVHAFIANFAASPPVRPATAASEGLSGSPCVAKGLVCGPTDVSTSSIQPRARTRPRS